MPKKPTEGKAAETEVFGSRARIPQAGEPITASVEIRLPDAARQMMATLARRIDPETLCNRIEEGLEAMTPPIQTKDGKIISRPDYATRLRYIDMAFAYLVGRPVERQEVITGKAPASLDDLVARAQQSPVFRDTMLALLQRLADAAPPESESRRPT